MLTSVESFVKFPLRISVMKGVAGRTLIVERSEDFSVPVEAWKVREAEPNFWRALALKEALTSWPSEMVRGLVDSPMISS